MELHIAAKMAPMALVLNVSAYLLQKLCSLNFRTEAEAPNSPQRHLLDRLQSIARIYYTRQDYFQNGPNDRCALAAGQNFSSG